VVHHAIVFLEEPGRKALPWEELRRMPPDRRPPQPQDGATGFFAITVPGSLGMMFPDGTGKRLPKGAWLKFEIHYQPNGKKVMDRTALGLRFSEEPLREIESRAAVNPVFVIPPRAPHHEVEADYRFCRAGSLIALFPHMHLRGAAFRYQLRYPGGATRDLLDVPRYDFNWQSQYQFREPMAVPAGATLHATAWYDNSPANPWNPDPSKELRYGQKVTDEMMIGYFDFLPARGTSPCV
jgi:hypothetical protein